MDPDPQLLRSLFDAAPVAMALVDARGADLPVIYVNRSFETLTGYAADELLGRNLRLLQGDSPDQDGRHRMREAIDRGEACRASLRNFRKDGSAFWNDISLVPLRDPAGELSHFAAFYRDPAAERAEVPVTPVPMPGVGVQREDRLTGLLTAAYLGELLRRDWAVAQRECLRVTLFSIDIDALELYNATFGRAAGDSVIRRVGHCIAGCLRRASDATARLEGGRFLAFATGLDTDQALRLAGSVAERVRELRIHHPRCVVLRYITVSIGVANAIVQPTQVPESLIQVAHQRLLAAKQAGRNSVH